MVLPGVLLHIHDLSQSTTGLMMGGGGPKKWNLFIKTCLFILTCLNFSQLQSTVRFMQYPYQDELSTAQNSFWTCLFRCLLVCLPFFCFPASTSGKSFPLRTVIIHGDRKSHSERDQVNREDGVQGASSHFGQKLLNREVGLAGVGEVVGGKCRPL